MVMDKVTADAKSSIELMKKILPMDRSPTLDIKQMVSNLLGMIKEVAKVQP